MEYQEGMYLLLFDYSSGACDLTVDSFFYVDIQMVPLTINLVQGTLNQRKFYNKLRTAKMTNEWLTEATNDYFNFLKLRRVFLSVSSFIHCNCQLIFLFHQELLVKWKDGRSPSTLLKDWSDMAHPCKTVRLWGLTGLLLTLFFTFLDDASNALLKGVHGNNRRSDGP